MPLVINGKPLSDETKEALLAMLYREVRAMRRWAASVGGSPELEREANRLREVIEAVVGETKTQGELT